ncbi:hypothetical protein C8R45DRAFT_938375 [Mycena sanguinolenta]|nr:hypothetical protein C8R45DRAFT_938375 [Mycena sanguinolenta]
MSRRSNLRPSRPSVYVLRLGPVPMPKCEKIKEKKEFSIMRVENPSPTLTAAATSHRTSKYIDDRAEVDHDAEMHETAIDDDPTHTRRSPLLRSRTPDAPMQNPPLFLPGSREPTPFTSYGWLQNPAILRQPTPHAYPPPDLRPGLPPIAQHPPVPSPPDLFAPGASFVQHPTLQAQKRTHEDEERSQDEDAPIATRRPKRACRAPDEETDNEETDGEEFHPPKSSFFLEPDTGSKADGEEKEEKRPVSVFLDIAAEDSDEDGEDGEDDLEETFSDKEFLDNTPQLESAPPISPTPAKERDNALALARYYEQRAKEEGYSARDSDSDSEREYLSKSKGPALPGIEPALSRGTPTSRIQPIEKATRVLYVPNTPASWIRFCDKKKVKQRADSGFIITNKDRKPYTNLSFKRVPRPSAQDLFPYYRCTHSLLLALRCEWPTPAFAEPRAHVVAADGPHNGRAGIIVRLVDAEEDGAIVKCADVQCVDADPTGDCHPFRVRLNHLERHELDPCYQFRPHDRVRVVDGALYVGLVGHVLELDEQQRVKVHPKKQVVKQVNNFASMIFGVPLDCDVIGLAEPSPHWPGLKTFEIPISYAMREFHLGDLVEVKVGEHTGRIGVIVALEGARWVRIWDTKNFASVLIETPALEFYHETTDLLPLMGPQEIESPWKAEIGDVVRVKQGKYVSRVGTVVAVHDQNFLELKDNAAASTHIYVKSVEVELSTSRMKYGAGRRFEGIEVQVNPGKFKGLRGAVVGDHDSRVRVERMDSKNKHAWASLGDSRGIILSIGKERSNKVVENIPIEHVVHEFTMLPLSQARWLPKKILCGQAKPREPPTHRGAFPNDEPPVKRPPTPPRPIGAEPLKISGEDDGQWLSMPDLANKRVDVKLVGLRQLTVHLSDVQLALEGTFCHVLIGTPAVSAKDKQVEVCGAGKTSRKFKIDRTCIKPRREGDNKESLAQVETRVVVIGPDIMFEGTCLGQYGQTVPSWGHHYGEGVVPVHFEEGAGGFFHESSLCMARNVKIIKDKRRRRKRFDASKRVKARPPKSESAGAKWALKRCWILRVEDPDGTARAYLNCPFCAAREEWRPGAGRAQAGASPSKTWSAANIQEGQQVAGRVKKHARPPPPNPMRAAPGYSKAGLKTRHGASWESEALGAYRALSDVLPLHGMPRMSVLHPSDTVQGSHCVTGTAFDLLSFAAILPRRHPAAPLKSTLLYSPLLGRLHDYEFVRRRAASDFDTQWRGSRNLLLQRRKDLAAASPHGEVGACPIWVADSFDEIVLYLPWCPPSKGVFERRPGGRGWNPTAGINWVVDGSVLVYDSPSKAERAWRCFGKDAMVLATPHWNWSVASKRIHEITGKHPKHPEDLDLMDYITEEENRQEAWAGEDESSSEDELLEDDEDA